MPTTFYYKNKAAGLCAICGCRPPAPDRTACPDCLKRTRGKNKRRIREWKSKGLCSTCGQHSPQPGKATCEQCLARGRKRGKKTYLERRQAGLCTICGKRPPVAEHALCLQCRQEYYRKNTLREKESPRYKALVRDNFTCQLCGFTERPLVHHIDGKGESKNGRRVPVQQVNDEMDNLITLCCGCHRALNTIIHQIVNVQLFISLVKAQRKFTLGDS